MLIIRVLIDNMSRRQTLSVLEDALIDYERDWPAAGLVDAGLRCFPRTGGRYGTQQAMMGKPMQHPPSPPEIVSDCVANTLTTLTGG